MSNEEHVEEMYFLAHVSGVFREFSEEVTRLRIEDPKKNFSEVVESVFEKFERQGLIEDELHLFI
ncbi:MAG: hypothetical protein EBS55_15150 [Flavobacteriaceae bacterium]|jgi:hypothetical protein|nr:hypothetical protein [Flavobacteriaceae bacterium]